MGHSEHFECSKENIEKIINKIKESLPENPPGSVVVVRRSLIEKRDKNLVREIRNYLEKSGYSVTTYNDEEEYHIICEINKIKNRI